MSAKVPNRKAELEQVLTDMVKAAVEITVRSPENFEFTLSADGDRSESMEEVRKFLELSGSLAEWEVLYDEECDQTYAYYTINNYESGT